MSFTHLKNYSKFNTVKEMDQHVKLHTHTHYYELTASAREVLFTIAKYALKYVGAAHLKAETIANEIGISTKSVYRAVKQLVEFNIIEKENKGKMNGIKGANIYSILPHVPSNVPSEMSERENHEKPCEPKFEAAKENDQSLILLSPSQVSKDTNITDMPNKSDLLKQGLLNKIPSVLAKAISPFMNSIDDIYNLVGTIFRAKGKVDKSIQIEQHAQLYHKAIVSVFESQKRAARKDKVFNVFGVMYKAIMDVTTAITTGEAYKAPVKEQCELELTAKQGGKFEVAPQWLIDQEQDPIKKARLIKQNEIAMQQRKSNKGKEALPSWFVPLTEQTKEEPKETIELDIETEHKRIMQALGIDA